MKWLITIILTVILLLFLIAPVQAEDKYSWDTTDTALQVTYTVLHVMDWSQTLYIARNPNRYYEKNNFLGKHPSEGSVNTLLALGLIGHTAVAIALPKEWEVRGIKIPARNIWQAFWIGVAQDSVRHNVRVGIKVHF